MPVLDHKPIRQDHDDDHYDKLMDSSTKMTMISHQCFLISLQGQL